jgi:hypothetical protein
MTLNYREQAINLVTFQRERTTAKTDSFTRLDLWAEVAALALIEVERCLRETDVDDDQLELDIAVQCGQAGAIA